MHIVSTTGLKINESSSELLPEYLLTIGLDKELADLTPEMKSQELQRYVDNFNFDKFHADIENRLRQDGLSIFNELRKRPGSKQKEMLQLYRSISASNNDESPIVNDLENEILDMLLDEEQNANKRKKQDPDRPTLKMGSNDDEDELKQKQKKEYVFNPPKLLKV